MKFYFLLLAIATLALSASECSKKKETGQVYKGKLEIKAICSNYTISVKEGDMDTSLVVANWTDENTNKSYTRAFKLGNPCVFPTTINQGDEFYFEIDTAKQEDCIVCMAYYPTPPKSLNIKVVEKK